MTKRGFTLLETMMVTAILSVVLIGVSMTLKGASDEVSVSIPETDLQTNSQRTLRRIVEELTDALAGTANVTVAADGRWIRFRAPVKVWESWTRDDGTAPTYAAEWGARLGGAETSGGFNAIAFIQSTVPDVSPLNESDVVDGGVNINVNTEQTADETDSFAMGHLVLIYDPDASYPTMSGDETVRQITGDWVAQVAVGTDFGGDVDGDGNVDPLFGYDDTARTVTIDLWGLRVIRQQRMPLVVNENTTVVLRNVP
ncbi:MAG: PulJ/GspJ family protein [Planctomycetota bacterium]|jgi:prepilin-type N-terminal cleavage/methylation domain-containing protein